MGQSGISKRIVSAIGSHAADWVAPAAGAAIVAGAPAAALLVAFVAASLVAQIGGDAGAESDLQRRIETWLEQLIRQQKSLKDGIEAIAAGQAANLSVSEEHALQLRRGAEELLDVVNTRSDQLDAALARHESLLLHVGTWLEKWCAAREEQAARFHYEDKSEHERTRAMVRDLKDEIKAVTRRRPAVLSRPTNNFVEAGVHRNPDFVGRSQFISMLHKHLAASDAEAFALVGYGGIGKTQVATEYAHRYEREYRGVWWINASSTAIDASTARLAEVLDLNLPPGTPPAAVREAICKTLSASRHLLILDNVESESEIATFRVRSPARVLVTTRRANLPVSIQTLQIPAMNDAEALLLLRKHRPDLSDAIHDAALVRVCQHLGSHPLAVALAGAYLKRRQNLHPDELLARLRQAEIGDPGDVFEKLDPAEEIGVGYALKVAQCLALHLDELSGPARDLVNASAFCAANAIPLNLLCGLRSGRSQQETEDALIELASRSITQYTQTVNIHPLTQSVIRAKLPPEERHSIAARLVSVLCELLERSSDPASWRACTAHVPHAESILSHVARLGPVPRTAALAMRVGAYLQQHSSNDRALATLLFAQTVIMATPPEQTHPDDAGELVNIVFCAASCYASLGHYDKALDWLRGIDARIPQPVAPEFRASIYNSISSVLWERGWRQDLPEALTLVQKAEELRSGLPSKCMPTIGTLLNNKATILHDLGRLEEAEVAARAAIKHVRDMYPPDHPDIARSLHTLASIVRDIGRRDNSRPKLVEALECHRQATDADRTFFSDDHIKVAKGNNNIATVLTDMGNKKGARLHLAKALPVALRSYGVRANPTIRCAASLRANGGDPVALARRILGEASAEELRKTLDAMPNLPKPRSRSGAQTGHTEKKERNRTKRKKRR